MRAELRPSALALAACLFAVPLAADQRPQLEDRTVGAQVQQLLREGQRLMAGDDYGAAARSFQEAIALDPHRMMAHYGLGTARMGLKEYPSAIVAFQAARDAFHARAAEFAWLQGQVEHARADRVAAVGSQVRNENRTQWREDVAALERLREEAKEFPQPPPGLSLALGSAYFRTGQLADAEREYRAAIEAQPKLGEPRSNLAVVLLITGRPAEAKEQLKLAKKNGFKPPAGLEADIEAALAKGPGKAP
jgi:Flp pilus assembly protein TadD